MAKSKSVFVCGECGYESSGWLGKCPVCGEWNTFFEQKLDTGTAKAASGKRIGIGTGGQTGLGGLEVVTVKEAVSADGELLCGQENIQQNDHSDGHTKGKGGQKLGSAGRITTNINEFDRVLGGGIVRDSLVLVGGDPGIGKSTILLQAGGMIKQEGKILYVSGEESISQIGMRADRLGIDNDKLLLLSETNFDIIEDYILTAQPDDKPSVLIIDSIQTMYTQNVDSVQGSVSQVRTITASLMKLAKNNKIAVFIVGHVTKDGSIAGPKILEHMVDTVLYFEGENHMNYRILRSVKNRFGSTNEIGIFEMKKGGLYEVPNPSESMLKGRPANEPGSTVVSTIEGSRAMLVEVQALASPTAFGVPRRTATGFDYNRMILLLAVLEKKIGLMTGDKDAYINIVGGLKLTEPACDLGVAAAFISSIMNKAADQSAVYIGEVGLAGEIRAVNQIEKRIIEAERIGFKTVIIPLDNYNVLAKDNSLEDYKNINLKSIASVKELI